MSKTQKYSSIISIKADADFSSLINALDKVQNELKGKTKGKDIVDIEESLNKIKQLQEKLKTIRERGFSSPKDVGDYNRLMDQLIDKATDVQAAFKRIHLTGLDKEVDKLDNDLKKAKNNIKNIANEIGKAVSKATKGNENSADFVTETKKAIETGKDLQKVQENITQTIQAQITAQKQLVAEQQKRIDSVKYKNSISHVTAQSFTFDESKKSRWKGPDDNKSIMNYVTSSYNKVLENKNITTSASAMTKFIELLDKVGLKFKDNSKAIEKFDQAFTKAYDSEGSILLQANKQLKEQTETLKDLEAQAKNSENIFGTKTVQSLLEQYKNGAINIEELTKKLEQARVEANNKQLPQSINNVSTELNNGSKKSQEFQSSLNNVSQSQVQFDSVSNSIASFTKRILSVTTAYHTLRRVIRSTFEDIKNLDKAFGSIAMVTDYSVSDMWQQYTTYAEMANKLGQTTQSVIEASGLYYQQGLETVEVMKLTEDTMKLATLAGLDFKEATSQMTGALRAFHMEMDQGAHVTDVYASLAASAAADVNGISEAMSATAAIAHSAGMSFENTSAMLTTMIEATQEAPKNLGTAMKAIIARFTELKNSVAGTAASEFEDLDYNKVDKALKSVGISIKDAAGQFRNLDDVFLELSGKWNTLDRNTQRYIATIAAGSRQQSRFIALMENYDRTMELIEVADNSANKADKQFAKYSDTIEFKLNRLKNTWEQAKTTVFTSDFFGGLIEGATYLVEKLEKLNWGKLLVMLPAALAAGRMMGRTWIQGFSEGANTLRGIMRGAGTKFNPEGKSVIELKKEYKQAKSNFGDGYTYRDYKKSAANALKKSDTYDKLVREQSWRQARANDIYNAYKNEQVKLEQNRKDHIDSANMAYQQNRVDEAKQRMSQAQKEYEVAKQAVTDYEKTAAESFEKIKEQRDNLYKAQVWSAIGQAAGMAVGTALTMGIMGTFKASEIATTICIQMATTTASMLASGNWIGAAISGVATAASFGLSALFNYLEEEDEKRKQAINTVYKHEKALEELEKEQEILNQKLDKANKAYDEGKEKFDSFNEAKDTYTELTSKIALNEEEQEKLNQATQTLVDMHPELVRGYDNQKNAILDMGTAWDAVIAKEEKYWDDVQKKQAEEELTAAAGKLAIDLENADKDQAYQEQLRDILNDNLKGQDWKYNFFGAAATVREFSLSEILTRDSWDTTGNTNYDTDNLIKSLSERSTAFKDMFIKAVSDVTGATFRDLESAMAAIDDNYDKYNFDSDDLMWQEVSKVLQKNIDDLEVTIASAEDDLKQHEQDVLDASETYKQSMINMLRYQISNLDLNDKDKKQLLAMLSSRINTEDIKDKIEQNIKENGNKFNQNKFKNTINDWITTDFMGDELVSDFESLNEYQSNLIGEYYEKLGDSTLQEIEKFRQKIANAGVGSEILTQLDTEYNNTKEAIEQQNKQLAEYFGKGYGYSALEETFNKLGQESQKKFISSLAKFDDKTANLITQSINDMLEKVDIDPNILQNLMSIDWQNMSVVDLEPEKKKFVDFAKEQGKTIAEAESYWNEYKNFMSNLGILDIAKEEFSGEALLAQLEEKLDEKLKTGKISSAIENSLKNGFISFSESNDFRKACEQMGLDAGDYIVEGIGGMEQINVDAFEDAVKKQAEDEEQIVETLRQQYQEKINNLNIQIELLKAQKESIDETAASTRIASILASKYKDAAAYAFALSHNLNPELVTAGDYQTFHYDIDDSELDATITSLTEEEQKLEEVLNNDLVAGSDFMKSYIARNRSYIYQIVEDIEKGKKSAAESYSDLVQAKKDMEAANKALSRAEEDLAEKLYQEGKAWRDLQRAQYGDPNRTGKLDGLYNYSTALDNISRKASKAKEKLDDLSKEDNVDQLLATYTTEIHNEIVIRGAEDSAIKTAMANTEQQLAQYSEYWDKIGDTYVININKLNAASMSDLLKDEIENQVDQLNKWQKILYDNQDAIDKLRKQFEDDQKKALQAYVDVEKEVVNTLKEQYEKQVKDLKDKNEAMKDADDDYLDALEKAIDKERKLRDRQNQWDDLAKKEKKLSLISRDTSGAQQIETQKLQQEVEKDRTQLLDDTIDDVVDSLKELYELQQESREAEIEYMEAMLDNASLIKEANEIIQNWGSNEDAVNWFLTNKDLTKMSAAEIELEKKNWNDLYEAKILYEKQSKIDFDKYLEATQEEINEKIGNLQTSITDQSAKAFAAVKENIDDAIHSAQQAYNSAKQSYEDQKEAMEKLQMTATAATDFYNELRKQLAKMSGLSEDATPEEIYAALNKKQEQNGNDYGRKAASEGNARANKNRTTTQDSTDKLAQELTNSYNNATIDPERDAIRAEARKQGLTWNGYKFEEAKTNSSGQTNSNKAVTSKIQPGSEYAREQEQKGKEKVLKAAIHEAFGEKEFSGGWTKNADIYNYYKKNGGPELADLIRQMYGLNYIDNILHFYEDESNKELYISPTDVSAFQKKNYYHMRYAKGGLVDYTGPAWVDGSPSNPEAFLSVDDTRLIGNLINLLTNIPSLNPNTNPTEISTSNIGDTTVNLTVNFDSVSEDYDAERVIDLMKEKIVEAANYTGANVILNKR